MKTKLKTLAITMFLTGIFVINTSYTNDVYEYVPIFMKRAELEKSISYQSTAHDLVQPGKIYYKTPYIYVNEKYKGVHIINNTNPKNPVNEAFIVAPGCIDMAVKGHIIYLDNAVDLVAFDMNTKQVTARIKNVFPEPASPDNYYYSTWDRPENLILVGWKKNPLKN